MEKSVQWIYDFGPYEHTEITELFRGVEGYSLLGWGGGYFCCQSELLDLETNSKK